MRGSQWSSLYVQSGFWIVCVMVRWWRVQTLWPANHKQFYCWSKMLLFSPQPRITNADVYETISQISDPLWPLIMRTNDLSEATGGKSTPIRVVNFELENENRSNSELYICDEKQVIYLFLTYCSVLGYNKPCVLITLYLEQAKRNREWKKTLLHIRSVFGKIPLKIYQYEF